LLTCGDKGTKDRSITTDALCNLRQQEQRAAAAILGVEDVRFMDHPDGYLVPDLNLRKEITRVIRQEHPDVLVTCDPTNLYVRETYLNHPDHRAAGQATLDAVFPAARDHLNFIELWRDEQLEPHIVREVWISLAQDPDVAVDITEHWDLKLRALSEHVSQVGDRDQLEERLRARHTPDSSPENPRYEEKFKRLVLG
jgi:LmbE family N-acetylglucosaminyl deacetylase